MSTHPRSMTSQSRLLAAISCQSVDHVPCSFMLFKGLWNKSATYLDFIQNQVDMGLDTFVQIPPRQPGLMNDSYNLHGLPVRYHPAVTVREWKDQTLDEKFPILIKEYDTPAGTLRAEIRQDEGWPYGDHVPFLDDYLETRSRKFIIECKNDLEALRFLLVPPSPEEIAAFQADSKPIIEFAHQRDLLITGGWGVGADLIGWVFGLQNMIYAVYDQPDLLRELLELIRAWNYLRMQTVLDAGVDLYIKRAWYENYDFWSPKTWREFIFPILKSEAELAHQNNSYFGYLITARCMPLLDLIAEAGVDVIIGVDPARWDLLSAKEKLGGKVCLWGGVNGHLTVEQGTTKSVIDEVNDAFRVLKDGSGFILSPVDNVRELTQLSQQNVMALIHEWQHLTGQP